MTNWSKISKKSKSTNGCGVSVAIGLTMWFHHNYGGMKANEALYWFESLAETECLMFYCSTSKGLHLLQYQLQNEGSCTVEAYWLCGHTRLPELGF